jgi:hypothetical protein
VGGEFEAERGLTMSRRACVARLLGFAMIVTAAASALAEGDKRGWLLPMPEVDADPKVPTLKSIVGHDWGEDISSHAEIERYLHALSESAPDRTRLVRYGTTIERRGLYYLVITSPKNLSRLDQIRGANLRLANPRATTAEEARVITESAPAVVWIAYGVHGDEISSGDAALVTAYHLIADRAAPTRAMLEKVVVILDPMQNPDGRDRFVNFHRSGRGVAPDPEPLAAERVQGWAGGRFNHYLFDMNRDWFLQTQSETKARVAAMLSWQPQVTIDAHEMGSNSEYYFDPPADPILELITPKQREWFARFGTRQGRKFDQFGFPYTSREVYDAFYPGYGSTWPTLHGSIGILWEQAGARGLLVDRDDQSKLYYHDGVRHHYVSSLSTVETAAAMRQELVRDYYDYRSSAVALGREGSVRDFVLVPGSTPARAARLARLLVANGIEVRRLTEPTTLKAKAGIEGTARDHKVAAGSYHVPVAQPAGRLALSLLAVRFDMGEEFRKRQLDRKVRRLGDEIYDLTAWSLPLAYGVTSLTVEGTSKIVSEPEPSPRGAGRVNGPARAKVGYLIHADDEAAMIALGVLLGRGYRVHVFDQPTTLAGDKFAKGTLLLRTVENPESIHAAIRELALEHGLSVLATDTGLVDEGAGLGSFHVTWVKPPKIAMLVDRPTSPFVGHTWYLFDQEWHYPVTRIPGLALAGLDLSKYNVLILPDGRYPGPLGEPWVARLKDWVKAGGTLVLVKGAASWATEKSVGLLAAKVVKKVVKTEPEPKPPAPEKGEKPAAASEAKADGEKPEETPDPVPGAFLRATVYDDHFVTFGSPGEIFPLVNTDLILTPLKPTDGRNLVNFTTRELLVSGFCWPPTLELLAGKPLVLYEEVGAGHVIAFTDDPNYRAMSPPTQRFFLNAVFLGPGH